MTKRGVVYVILLSIITCGIYAIYWTYVTALELNSRDRNEPLTNYFVAILLSIITCGIYGIYWMYKFYKKADIVTGENNIVINFILYFFTGGIVSMAIMQSSFNKM